MDTIVVVGATVDEESVIDEWLACEDNDLARRMVYLLETLPDRFAWSSEDPDVPMEEISFCAGALDGLRHLCRLAGLEVIDVSM